MCYVSFCRIPNASNIRIEDMLIGLGASVAHVYQIGAQLEGAVAMQVMLFQFQCSSALRRSCPIRSVKSASKTEKFPSTRSSQETTNMITRHATDCARTVDREDDSPDTK